MRKLLGAAAGLALLCALSGAGLVTQSGPRLFTSGSSLADGATVTRTGPSATMPNQEFLGGVTGFNASAVSGTTFSRTNWSILTPATAMMPHSDSEFALNRATAVLSDFRSSLEYKQTRIFDTGASGYSSIYASWWDRYSHDSLSGGQSIQRKMMRWLNVADVQDSDGGAYMANWDGVATAFFTNFRNVTANQDTLFYDNSTGSLTDIPSGTSWQRFEIWLVNNTPSGTANGYFRVKVTTTAGVTLVDNVSTNRRFRDSGDSLGNFRYITPQDYVGNATDGGPGPDNKNATAAHDDEHFLWLTSGTGFPARAELVNNVVYASSTVRRTCELVSITGTSWVVKLNGPFSAFGVTDLTGLYLALFDSAGTPTMVILDVTPALRVPEWVRDLDAANDDQTYQVAA